MPRGSQIEVWGYQIQAWKFLGGVQGAFSVSWARGRVLGAVSCRKSSQHSPNLGAKMDAKSFKNQQKIDANIDQKINAFQDWFFMRFRMDFGRENGGKLASKSCQKSMLTSNGRFSRKPIKTNSFSMIFVDLGKQVGTENRSKID